MSVEMMLVKSWDKSRSKHETNHTKLNRNHILDNLELQDHGKSNFWFASEHTFFFFWACIRAHMEFKTSRLTWNLEVLENQLENQYKNLWKSIWSNEISKSSTIVAPVYIYLVSGLPKLEIWNLQHKSQISRIWENSQEKRETWENHQTRVAHVMEITIGTPRLARSSNEISFPSSPLVH